MNRYVSVYSVYRNEKQRHLSELVLLKSSELTVLETQVLHLQAAAVTAFSPYTP